MRLLNIAQRVVTVELDLEDCVRLAKACRVAYVEHGGLSETHWIGPIYDALALELDTAAMAAQSANTLDDHADTPISLASATASAVSGGCSSLQVAP